MIEIVTGEPGSGKSYLSVNYILARFLRDTERHIYTNLPVNVEELVHFVARSPAAQERMRARLHLLKKETAIPLDKDGNPQRGEDGKEVGERCRLREFWYFTQPNSIIMIDEAGQIWKARDWQDEKKGTLGAYMAEHRHYKDTIFFVTQKMDQLSKQIKDMAVYVWQAHNSKQRNIVDSAWGMGMRWPMQFFICEKWSQATGKLVDKWTIWPNKAGFKCYRSFSASTAFPDKALADDRAQSEDVGVPWWKQILSWWRRGKILLIAGIGLYIFITTLAETWQGMKSKTATVGSFGTSKPAEKPAHPSLPAINPLPSPAPLASSATEKPADDNKITFISPQYFRTASGAVYGLNDELNGKHIGEIRINGILFIGQPGLVPWHMVFSGGRSESKRSRRSHKRAVGSVGPAVTGPISEDVIRAAHERISQASSRGPSVSPGQPVHQ